MIAGIDIGGTFSDGTLLKKADGDFYEIVHTVKVPTDYSSLSDTLIKVIEQLGLDRENSETKITVSTTLLTNLAAKTAAGRCTGFLVVPGPGISAADLEIPFFWREAAGTVDFTGKIQEDITEYEIEKKIRELVDQDGAEELGIVTKFSCRNSEMERRIKKIALAYFPENRILTGSSVSSKLNFPRRISSTGITFLCRQEFRNLIESLRKYFISGKNIHILKADGGTVPLDASDDYLIDTVFSGPAASALGGLVLNAGEDFRAEIIVDIGGTTMDVSYIDGDFPLVSSYGGNMGKYRTGVRAFAVNSYPLGGNSVIEICNGDLQLSEKSNDPGLANGGKRLTLNDILLWAGFSDFGDRGSVEKGLDSLFASEKEEKVRVFLPKICTCFIANIDDSLKKWNNEPRYHISKVMNKKEVDPDRILLVGGPGKSLAELLNMYSGRFICSYDDSCGRVANSIGAAMSKTALREKVHINTAEGLFSTSWGQEGRIKGEFTLEEAIDFSLRIFGEKTEHEKINEETVLFDAEQFNIIRGYRRLGRIFEIEIGIEPGLTGRLMKAGEHRHE